jgi:hypothetical protein
VPPVPPVVILPSPPPPPLAASSPKPLPVRHPASHEPPSPSLVDIDLDHPITTTISSLASLRLLQHASLYRSLLAHGFEIAELDDDDDASPSWRTFQILEPDITFGPTDCAIFFKLAKLPGGAFRPEELVPDPPPLVRHEAVFTTLWRLSERFDRMLAVFEKPGRVVEAFTPPVVRALDELKSGIERMCELREEEDEGGSGMGPPRRLLVELAFVDSPGQGAKVVREFADRVRATSHWTVIQDDLGPAQTWLDVDISEVRLLLSWMGSAGSRGSSSWHMSVLSFFQDEGSLVALGLSRFASRAILSVCSAIDFAEMSSEERSLRFGPMLGPSRTVRAPLSPSYLFN